MAKYYLDFVGLNTFIYEPVVFDFDEWTGPSFSDSLGKNVFTQVEGIEVEGVFAEVGKNVAGHSDHFYPNVNFFGWSRFIPNELGVYKNLKFSYELPNTASFFPALMLHRNGPYGHPTWKQLRVSQNPLTRKQVKNSIFTHVQEPGSAVQIEGAQINGRYGDIRAFIETPIISRYRPVAIEVAYSEKTPISMRLSVGNSLCHFNNKELDEYYIFDNCESYEYNIVKNMYLNGGLENESSLINQFNLLKYTETVYPRQLYTNKSYTRQRTNFSFDWRDDRANRLQRDDNAIDNGFGTNLDVQSMWPLDVTTEWAVGTRQRSNFGFSLVPAIADTIISYIGKFADAGILQNVYSSFAAGLNSFVTSSTINSALAPAPFYNRRHMLTPSASVVSPNGMVIEGINSGTTFGDLDTMSTTSGLFGTGEAKWEAGDQSGKNPFYDSYDEYVQGVRQRGKGYSIVPEFRISNHIPTIVAEGVDKNFSNMFEITGGLLSANGSDEENFYKIYSTTEFLKHFDLVKQDHKDFVEPASIKLKCKVIKKFLPYNGFYPCQRTVEIAQQFYSSYSDAVTVATGSSFDFQPLANSAQIGFQNLLAPLFAPGVLFNTIKGGVACDYPIITGSINEDNGRVTRDGDNYLLNRANSSNTETHTIFDKRIPFNALIEPQRFLAQQPIFCNEPHIDANHSSSVFWDGTGDNLYKMMTHNFLAEVPSFFLQGQQFSTIYSLPSDNPNVGNAISGSTYKMRVKMYKTIDGSSVPAVSSSGGNEGYFVQPQYSSDVRENFTMYSRPSAFGPPSRATNTYSGFINMVGSDSKIGENYPFTPPYYYGQAWADIKFTAKETKKYTIDEIIRDSIVTKWRFIDADSGGGSGAIAELRAGLINDLYNLNAMHIDASVDLFAQGEIKSVDLLDDSTSDEVNVAVDISNKEKSRWIIQSFFETPMLNFNHLSASTSLTLPTNGSQSVPRGMWHQYGRIETDSSKGVFLQVTDIPDDFRIKVSGSIFDKSLVKLCGFKDEPKRLGQVAQAKVISEAVVAIPFIEEDNQRKFFTLDTGTINFVKRAKSIAEGGTVSKTIIRMVDMMRKYVIPPSLDFVHRDEIEPFAMYIFEFNHTLSQQDLADIWQNLPPTIGQSFEEAEASIEHSLLAHELLGGGKTIINGKIEKGNPLPEKIRWMVFKAKKRAETNYYDKIVGEQDTTVAGTNRKDFTTRRLARQAASILRPEGVDVNVSYNWPYDFFSLVELVQLEAEATLKNSTVDIDEETSPILPETTYPTIEEGLEEDTDAVREMRDAIAESNRRRGKGGFKSRSKSTTTDEPSGNQPPKNTYVWTAVLPATVTISIPYVNNMGAVATTPPGFRYNGRVKKNNKSEVRKYLTDAGFTVIDNIAKV